MNSQILILFCKGLVIVASVNQSYVLSCMSHLLLTTYALQWDTREPDDPGKYLLAIWTPGRQIAISLPCLLSDEFRCSASICLLHASAQ